MLLELLLVGFTERVDDGRNYLIENSDGNVFVQEGFFSTNLNILFHWTPVLLSLINVRDLALLCTCI